MSPTSRSVRPHYRGLMVRTACLAVVEESWILRVPTDLAVRATTSGEEALNLLGSEFVVSVENIEVRGEQDRVVIEVTDTDAVGSPAACKAAVQAP